MGQNGPFPVVSGQSKYHQSIPENFLHKKHYFSSAKTRAVNLMGLGVGFRPLCIGTVHSGSKRKKRDRQG